LEAGKTENWLRLYRALREKVYTFSFIVFICAFETRREFLRQIAHVGFFPNGVVTTRNHAQLEPTVSNSLPPAPIVFRLVFILIVASEKIRELSCNPFGRHIV